MTIEICVGANRNVHPGQVGSVVGFYRYGDFREKSKVVTDHFGGHADHFGGRRGTGPGMGPVGSKSGLHRPKRPGT